MCQLFLQFSIIMLIFKNDIILITRDFNTVGLQIICEEGCIVELIDTRTSCLHIVAHIVIFYHSVRALRQAYIAKC